MSLLAYVSLYMESAKKGFKMSTDAEKDLPPAAARALKEARDRRAAREARIKAEKEVGGRDGPDPTRFGDWEKNGRAIDFS